MYCDCMVDHAATMEMPCGCAPAPARVGRYTKRVSGPLLGRIDLHVELPRVEYEKLAGRAEPERSAAVRERVEAARERQRTRFMGTKLTCNAEMGPARYGGSAC